MHLIDVPQGHVSPILHEHKGSCNHDGVDFIRLGFADVVLPQGCGLYRIDDTDLVIIGNKVLDQVVAVVSRRFKTDDEPVFAERIQLRGQEPEAITSSFVNWNGSISISSSDEMAEAKWLSLAMSMPT